MPIYITRSANFRTKVDAFERRGLTSQASAKVSELGIQVVSPRPIQNVIKYANMSTELHGRLGSSAIKYDDKPRAVLRRLSGEAPFESPHLIVEMKSGGEVLNGLGMFEVATSKQQIYGGQPTVTAFTTICQQGIDFYQNVPAGNVNIAGYIAFIQAWRGVRAFFAVGGGSTQEAEYRAWLTPKGATGIAPHPGIPATIAADGSLVREARPAKEGGGWVTVDNESLLFVSGSKVQFDGIPMVPAHEKALDFGGLLFPYFQEMLEPDVGFAYEVFSSLYSLCLEDSEGPTAEAIAVHRRGFRYLANTHAGRVLQHVYLGIKLAMETGAMLVLIKDGSAYAGFMLKGDDFRVAIQNRVYTPIASKDLSAELAALDTHNTALNALFDLLVDLPRIGGSEEERTLEEMSANPRVVREMVQARVPEAIQANREKISDLLQDLKFRQVFWEINEKNVVRFLEAMVFKYPLIDEPMYLHIDVLCNRSSDILAYLSVFGVQAPSIYHGSKSLQIGREGSEDPNLVVVDQKRKVPHIPFVNKGLAAAALDWASVYKQKAFRFTPAESKYGGRGFSAAKKRDGYVGNPEFDRFYSNLQRWVYTGIEKPAKVVNKKRRSEGEGDQEMTGGSGPSRKKTKFTFV